MREFNPVGAWNSRYEGVRQPSSYGNQDTYLLAKYLLDKPGSLEDWGCGLGFAKAYFEIASYLGIDGSKSRFCDVVEDLKLRQSTPDYVLMRHVIEHNLEWKEVLSNVVKCAQRRLLVIVFTFIVPETRYEFDKDGVPCISFKREEVLEVMHPWKPLEFFCGTDTCWLIDKERPRS